MFRRQKEALYDAGPNGHGGPVFYDCTKCGACCVNTARNAEDGYDAYVSIEPSDTILKRRDLVKKLVVLRDGLPHLRLGMEGRCLALAGAVGRSVRCTIYQHRPKACHRVQAGSRECLQHREDRGLSTS